MDAEPLRRTFDAAAGVYEAARPSYPAELYVKVHELLRAGGNLAFWSAGHAFPVDFDPFFAEIQSVYDALGEGRGDPWPPPTPDQVPDSAPEILASGLFEDVRVRRYVW